MTESTKKEFIDKNIIGLTLLMLLITPRGSSEEINEEGRVKWSKE